MPILPFSRRMKELGRLGHVLTVLTRHGFGWFIMRLRLEKFVPFRKRVLKGLVPPGEARSPSTAAHVAEALQELGPTYIKLGQILASRQDLIPPVYVREFRKLQDRVKPFPTDQARAQIESEFGRSVDSLFREFPDEPFAAGSIAQAYECVTHEGTPVVLKVRRPGIQELFESDIDILARLAMLAERYVPEYRVYRPEMLVEEFAQTVRRETDFIAEAANTERFREAFEDNPKIAVPRVLWELTSPAVLALEKVEGIPIYEEQKLAEAGVDEKALARNLTDCFLHQYFDLGLFHADPHPGNLMVQPPDGLGVFDFGQVGRISDTLRSRLGTCLIAGLNREFDIVVDVLDDIGALSEDVDEERFKSELSMLVDKYAGIPIKRMDLGSLFEELTATARQHHILLPRDFVLMGKSLVTVGGVALDLDPDLSMVEAVRPKVRSLATEKFSPGRIVRHGLKSGYHLSNLIEQFPRNLRDITRKLTRGKLQILFRHENLDRLITEMDRSSNRLAFAMIVAAVILGSAVIMQAKVGPALFWDIPILGLLGFLVAGVLGVGLAIAILRSGRL